MTTYTVTATNADEAVDTARAAYGDPLAGTATWRLCPGVYVVRVGDEESAR